MKYTKPEIVVTADAVSAIQNMGKPTGIPDNVLKELSTPAYEADE
ncbi:MAG: hypothetical protein WCA19_19715 [Candidatus Acidiferrales bacterium]